MPVTIGEKFDSREATVGVESPSVDLLYVVQGTDDDLTVKATVEAVIPAIYHGLPFQDYHIAPQGTGVWDVSVRYGKKEPKEPGESSFSFDTGGGTTHITQSLQTINKYAPVGKVAPDFKGAIGVTHDSVEGIGRIDARRVGSPREDMEVSPCMGRELLGDEARIADRVLKDPGGLGIIGVADDERDARLLLRGGAQGEAQRQ